MHWIYLAFSLHCSKNNLSWTMITLWIILPLTKGNNICAKVKAIVKLNFRSDLLIQQTYIWNEHWLKTLALEFCFMINSTMFLTVSFLSLTSISSPEEAKMSLFSLISWWPSIRSNCFVFGSHFQLNVLLCLLGISMPLSSFPSWLSIP